MQIDLDRWNIWSIVFFSWIIVGLSQRLNWCRIASMKGFIIASHEAFWASLTGACFVFLIIDHFWRAYMTAKIVLNILSKRRLEIYCLRFWNSNYWNGTEAPTHWLIQLSTPCGDWIPQQTFHSSYFEFIFWLKRAFPKPWDFSTVLITSRCHQAPSQTIGWALRHVGSVPIQQNRPRGHWDAISWS